jgi:purine nucleoside phosphorylase
MSTVPEALVAAHAGIKVLALSGIPNLCIDDNNRDDLVSSGPHLHRM